MTVRVRPRASRNAVEGFRDGVLLVRVTAPPADGQANEAVIDLLASALKVGKSRLAILRGRASRVKTIEVEGLSEQEVRARLTGFDGPAT